jgi:hypothetical protein
VPFPRAIATLLLCALPSGLAIAEEPRTLPIAIVVGVASPIRQVNKDMLRELYLRRQRLWANGDRGIPVNLPADDPVRIAFSRLILGRLPGDLEAYWLRLYREGIQPPLVLKTSQAVCAYVAVEPAAIGYVRAEAVDGKSCRILFILSAQSD